MSKQFLSSQFISALGSALLLPQSSIATSLHIFQKYTLKSAEHPYDIAAACLFLGSKIAGTVIRLQKVAEQCAKYSAQFDKTYSIQFLESNWKDSILYHEELILEFLQFEFDIVLPYKQMEKLFKKLELERDVSKMSWFICNDTFHSEICIEYEPQDIAVACIYTAFKHQEQPLPVEFWEITKSSKSLIHGVFF